MTATSEEIIASFHLIRYPDMRAMRYMAFDRPVLHRTGGLLFWRLLGTGQGPSMTIGADLRRWALFAVWRGERHLDAFLATSPIAARWRDEATEHWQVRLTPLTARGRWGGVNPFTGRTPAGGEGADTFTAHTPAGSESARPFTGRTPAYREGVSQAAVHPPEGPVAVLTRAAIRPSRLVAFYRSVPAVDRALRGRDGCLASVGAGEWPLARQATFSLWRDGEAVRDFAYRGTTHREVIGRVRSQDWYSEELFARFLPYGSEGSWNGADPLG
jgi:hypothetical protein